MTLRDTGLVVFASLAVLSPMPAGEIEASQQPSSRSMSLKESVIIALQQEFGLQIQALNVEIAAAQVGIAKADYEPLLVATVNYLDVTDPGGIDSQTREFQQSKSEIWRASTSVSGLLPTGGQYTVGASGSDTEGSRGNFDFSNATVQGPFIEFRQPLLENLQIDDTRLNIRLSQKGLEISTLDLRMAMLDIVNRVEEAYFNLVAAREFVGVQQSALGLAEELWRDNQRRVELGDMAPIEEAEARSQVAASRADLLNAERLVIAQQNLLKSAMVDDYSSWQAVTILPVGGLAREAVPFDFHQSWATALAARPDLQVLNLQLEQSFLVEKRRRNQLLPELDFTATAGYAGSGREFNRAFDQVGSRNAPYYSFGLSLALPLRNRRETENHRIAKAETEQAKLRLKQRRQGIMIELDDAISQAHTDYQRIAATGEAREFAEQALQNEQGKLARGATTNFVVLELQRNLTAARSEELQSLANYNRSLARLRLLEGVNLQAHQVEVTLEP